MAKETKSECCGATIGVTLGDGVLIGWCETCRTAVARVNPRTRKQEWLDGADPWDEGEMRPMEEAAS